MFRRKVFQPTAAHYVGQAREALKVLAGKYVPFVTVQHDIWDGVDHEVLGITVVFYNPELEVRHRLPIAMVRITGKMALVTANQTLEALKVIGVAKEDIFRCVNDTTNVAVKVGVLISGKKGTCNMHTVQLILEHATGRRTRSKKKQVIDDFPECDDVRKAAKESASYLMNKKAKHIYKKYVKFMQELSRRSVKLSLPNDTRAAGVVLMYRSLIKSRFNLKQYY